MLMGINSWVWRSKWQFKLTPSWWNEATNVLNKSLQLYGRYSGMINSGLLIIEVTEFISIMLRKCCLSCIVGRQVKHTLGRKKFYLPKSGLLLGVREQRSSFTLQRVVFSALLRLYLVWTGSWPLVFIFIASHTRTFGFENSAPSSSNELCAVSDSCGAAHNSLPISPFWLAVRRGIRFMVGVVLSESFSPSGLFASYACR